MELQELFQVISGDGVISGRRVLLRALSCG